MIVFDSGEVVRPQDKLILNAVLAEFMILQLEPPIIEAAIAIRGKSFVVQPKIKLPDAIIAATAQVQGAALVTRNAKDFSGVAIPLHTPYDYDSMTGVVFNVRAPYH